METIKEVIKTLIAIVPSFSWMKYAAFRLGAFIMSYAVTVAAIIVGTALAGITISFGAIFAILPIAVFFAIRVSGALTRHQDPDRRFDSN
jgi:hypothetical protein